MPALACSSVKWGRGDSKVVRNNWITACRTPHAWPASSAFILCPPQPSLLAGIRYCQRIWVFWGLSGGREPILLWPSSLCWVCGPWGPWPDSVSCQLLPRPVSCWRGDGGDCMASLAGPAWLPLFKALAIFLSLVPVPGPDSRWPLQVGLGAVSRPCFPRSTESPAWMWLRGPQLLFGPPLPPGGIIRDTRRAGPALFGPQMACTESRVAKPVSTLPATGRVSLGTA